MSAHTPGPWRKATTENASGEPMEVWEVHAESGGVVCGDFSIEADADLVAGAPDLETDWRRLVRERAGLQISLEGARVRAHEGDRAIVKLSEVVAEKDVALMYRSNEYAEHAAEWAHSEEVKDGEIEMLRADLGEINAQVCDTCRYQMTPEGWPETACNEIAGSREAPVPCAVVGNRCGTWKERP